MPFHKLRWPPSRWTLRGRVTAAATLVVGALLILGGVVFYQVVRTTTYEGLRDRGSAAADDLAELVRRDGLGNQSDLNGPWELPHAAAGFTLLQVVDDQGRVIAASAELKNRPAISTMRPAGDGDRLSASVDVPGVASEVYIVAERVRGDGAALTAYAAAPTTELRQVKGAFLVALALALLLALAMVALIVSRAVARALRPVRVMSAELAGITGGLPHGRVTVPGGDDEVADLAEAVNVTLHRLEAVLERQRGFVADVSHELRSPLTGLRAQLEVALEHPEDEDWPAVARAALGDADRLQQIVSDLLIMAKLDAGVPQDRGPVDLGELAGAEVARRRAGRVAIGIEAEEDVVVSGTRPHLARVLTNLLDNAERHAKERVDVTVVAEDGEAVLTVNDDGSGIAPQDREAVFRRFHRLAESRRRDIGGTGLGLPISRNIATAHGGTLVAAECVRGACLVLRLPLSGADGTDPGK